MIINRLPSLVSLFVFAVHANAAIVDVPDAILKSFGSDVNGHYGVHAINGVPVFGSYSQESGTVSANLGDDLRLTIRPAAGMQFMVDTTNLNSMVVAANFETLNSRFGTTGTPAFLNGTGSVTLNGVTGGTAPSVEPIVNANNSTFVTGPSNTPTGFFGQVTAFATHSNGQPFSSGGGVITFDSITLLMPNVAPLNWDENSLDNLSVYFGDSTNSELFTMVPVPEPSFGATVCGLSILGLSLGYRRRG